MKKKLTDIELQKLTEKLSNLEWEIMCQTGMQKISGGYANLSYDDFDDKNIYCTLSVGVDGEDDSVSTDEIVLDRLTLEVTKED